MLEDGGQGGGSAAGGPGRARRSGKGREAQGHPAQARDAAQAAGFLVTWGGGEGAGQRHGEEEAWREGAGEGPTDRPPRQTEAREKQAERSEMEKEDRHKTAGDRDGGRGQARGTRERRQEMEPVTGRVRDSQTSRHRKTGGERQRWTEADQGDGEKSEQIGQSVGIGRKVQTWGGGETQG